ncbi:serine acetyltransferase [Suicoccus acidiformans]|uniref:Serine acetyltransferase n=1 Tax=Suicoccus acidiformans TaxID=2036206 RepID=A0A347WN75_9LACT|nr:serine O-acetyltransferase EpsC [Suicoccus acidiformans]AXY26532.1 serine acetyltransferase [Suicoccus acidiformans]
MKARNNKRYRLATYIYQEDAAAHSIEEAYRYYPGVTALVMHERAHMHYQRGNFLLARKISEQARFLTGIEIHPGAQIDEPIFIDHGTGLVIGETSIIGPRVKLFHGVTLGGTGKEKDVKRHPTVEHDVLIGTGATILGDVRIGHHSKIGAGALVLEDVPPYATAVGVPARIIQRDPPEGDVTKTSKE